jgi:hypothetical protein
MDPQSPEKRVTLIQDRVIYVTELDNPTPETISQSAKYVRELSREWDQCRSVKEFWPELVRLN